MKSDFRLIGLVKPSTATLQFLNTDKTTFWAPFDMHIDRFNALFNWAKNEDEFWKTKWIAEVEHNGSFDDGTPRKPIVISIREWDL